MSLKNWKKWDWIYAMKYVGAVVGWIVAEGWFCWMIASNL